MDAACAHNSAPTPKIRAPAQNVLLAPIATVSSPVQVAARIDDARKAVVGQLIMVAPPTSSTRLGSTVATISTLTECRSTPPNSTASAGSRSGLRTSDHLPSVPCRILNPQLSVKEFVWQVAKLVGKEGGGGWRKRAMPNS